MKEINRIAFGNLCHVASDSPAIWMETIINLVELSIAEAENQWVCVLKYWLNFFICDSDVLGDAEGGHLW